MGIIRQFISIDIAGKAYNYSPVTTEEEMKRTPQISVPMPDDVREWLDKAAKKACRSRGSHVLALIRQQMEREERRAIYDANYIPSHALEKGK